MAYGNYHPLPPNPPKEKYVFGLNLAELVWLLVGLVLSYNLVKIIPPLPFVTNIIFIKIHAFIPLAISAILAFGKHPKTGLSINTEIKNTIDFKLRKRILIWRKKC
ncbi:MAG: hypothetical protein ACOYCB_13310 [Fastidiosipilaceae bacterium]|jgi:hypothetical protein